MLKDILTVQPKSRFEQVVHYYKQYESIESDPAHLERKRF